MATTSAFKAGPNLYSSVKSFRAFRKSLLSSVKVGFVPTMGALHEGHLSLVEQAISQNDVVVASIFVNPTQFGEGEDLDKYPRQMERDTKLLADLGVVRSLFLSHGLENQTMWNQMFFRWVCYLILFLFYLFDLQNHLFVPSIESMYGKNFGTYIDCQSFDDIPESIVRPGHFRGVATIVTKLFNIVQPTNAYFGQKDAGEPISAIQNVQFFWIYVQL